MRRLMLLPGTVAWAAPMCLIHYLVVLCDVYIAARRHLSFDGSHTWCVLLGRTSQQLLQRIYSHGQNVGKWTLLLSERLASVPITTLTPDGPGLPLTPPQYFGACVNLGNFFGLVYVTSGDYTLPCCSSKSEDGDVSFALFYHVPSGAVASFSSCVLAYKCRKCKNTWILWMIQENFMKWNRIILGDCLTFPVNLQWFQVLVPCWAATNACPLTHGIHQDYRKTLW